MVAALEILMGKRDIEKHKGERDIRANPDIWEILGKIGHSTKSAHILSHISAHIRCDVKAHIRTCIEAHIRSHIKAHNRTNS